ncbi:MAG TPA: hypothetical protein VMB52_06345 [Verrucomicrobiae bacterium]|nr:hypothetical protein [Verrucomicrobiae bacterium]
MRTSTAGYRSRYTRKKLVKRWLLAASTAIVVLAILLIAHTVLWSKTAGQAMPPAPVLSFSAKQDVDVHLVAAAVGQYVSSNGTLPTRLSVASNGGLVLCSDVCNPSLYELGGLSVYQAADIKLVNYTPDLMVSNQSTMYLVPSAKCDPSGRIGGPNSVPRSMVILYSTDTDSSPTPRCIVL